MHPAQRCGLLLQVYHGLCVCVCLLVTTIVCAKHPDAIWGVDSGEPMKQCIRWEPRSPHSKGQFGADMISLAWPWQQVSIGLHSWLSQWCQPDGVTVKCDDSFYRAMLCIRGTSHGPVSICVWHKSEFYRNGWTNQAGFWHVSFIRPILHCVIIKFGYLQK